MSKKGISTTHYKDGRKIFTTKTYGGIRVLKDWPCIKYSKLRFNTGYAIMVRLKNKEDLWLNLRRCTHVKHQKKVYLEPEYYKSNFRHIPIVNKVNI